MFKRLGGTYLGENDLREAGFRHVGSNVKIHDRASIYGLENISIGSHVRIDDYCVIVATGPVTIGNYVSIHNFCFLGARYGIELGNYVTLAPGCKLFSASDDYGGAFLTGPVVPREFTGGSCGPVVLSQHTIIGAGSVVLPRCRLAEGCAVGALSLVTGDLEAWGVYAGIPVKRFRDREKGLLAFSRVLDSEDGEAFSGAA